MLGEDSDSKIVIEIGREDCKRRRARVQPEGPAPMMAILRGIGLLDMLQTVGYSDLKRRNKYEMFCEDSTKSNPSL